MAIVEAKVKPERLILRDTSDGIRLKESWWQFGRTRPELYGTIISHNRVLAIARVGQHAAFTFLPNGFEFNIALNSDGSVVAWGDNMYGQTDIPPGLKDVVQIAAGYYHNLALKSDGTVVAWGAQNWDSSPMTVPAGLSRVVQIAAGGDHDLVLTRQGRPTTVYIPLLIRP